MQHVYDGLFVYTVRMLRGALGRVFLLAGWAAAPSFAVQPYDWLQFGFDSHHSGANPAETVITPANVGYFK
jgi:hypothetical protein